MATSQSHEWMPTPQPCSTWPGETTIFPRALTFISSITQKGRQMTRMTTKSPCDCGCGGVSTSHGTLLGGINAPCHGYTGGVTAHPGTVLSNPRVVSDLLGSRVQRRRFRGNQHGSVRLRPSAWPLLGRSKSVRSRARVLGRELCHKCEELSDPPRPGRLPRTLSPSPNCRAS